MELKLKYVRIITIGNTFIGYLAGLIGLIGIYNLLTDSSIGLTSRRSRSQGLALTTGEEVFVALIVAGIAFLYYISLDRINDSDNLSALFYHVLDNAFKKFYIMTAVLLICLVWLFDSYSTLAELFFGGLFFSFFLVIHLIVISTAFLTEPVSKFSFGNSKTKKSDSIENKLYEIESLYNRGLITEDEYLKKRKEIIDEI